MKSVRVFPISESPFEEEEILGDCAVQIAQRYVELIGISKYREIVKKTMTGYETEEMILQTIDKYEHSLIDGLSNGEKDGD